MSNNTQIKSVNIKAYARLHKGFFDLNGEQGRRFGSLGVSLNQPVTKIKLSLGRGNFTTLVSGATSEINLDYIDKSKQKLLKHLNIQEDVAIEVIDQIPRHAGLGSGTQMALAIGAGLKTLFKIKTLSLNEIAKVTDRGRRSGIGIGTFADGGFVVDGGRGINTQLPPIIAQHAIPESWRFLLVFDPSFKGVNGVEEVNAFKTLADHSLERTQALAHQVLTNALPAIVESDLETFGAAMNTLQVYNGDYFSPAQGGQYASASVTKVLKYLKENGAACAGQSSWGPTGFAIVESDIKARNMLDQLKQEFGATNLAFMVCEGCNHGAEIEIESEA